MKSDPFRKRACGRDGCVPCEKGTLGDCRTRGCVYQIECQEANCGRKYRGTTGRSTHERIGEHVCDWNRGEEKCPMSRHSLLYHEGNSFDFGVQVLRNCYGKPSRRMISEAVLISDLGEDETMNGKQEWTFVQLDKVNVA